MKERPPPIDRFFYYFALGFVGLCWRVPIIKAEPSIKELVSLLNTMYYVTPVAAIVAITAVLSEDFYYKIIRPKIFKDD